MFVTFLLLCGFVLYAVFHHPENYQSYSSEKRKASLQSDFHKHDQAVGETLQNLIQPRENSQCTARCTRRGSF